MKVGITASCFDLLHAGHCLMLKDAKDQCDYLIAALHVDPHGERHEKNSPVQTLEERFIILESNKYIDEILIYKTEDELVEIFKERKPGIRIIGSDWLGKKITGEELGIETYYHERDHNWSTSGLRKRIFEKELEK